MTREFAAQRQAAENLRTDLQRQNVDTRPLDGAISTLRQLEEGKVTGGPKGVDKLQAQVINGLKDFEYSLWRKFNANDTRPALGVQGQIPAEYQQMVEEYYRSLARQPAGKGGGNQ